MFPDENRWWEGDVCWAVAMANDKSEIIERVTEGSLFQTIRSGMELKIPNSGLLIPMNQPANRSVIESLFFLM